MQNISPETRKAALPGGPDRIGDFHAADNSMILIRQANRLARLYSLPYSVAVATAEIAYGGAACR